MQPFSHYLVTRVNLGYLEGRDERNFDSENWLDFRLNLLIKYAFPSVLNQSNKDFQWWIYFDADTPENYKLKIMEKFCRPGFIHIFFRSGSFGDLDYHLVNDLKINLHPKTEYLITTRIDSDDLIHKDFVKNIQLKFDRQRFTSINFNNGLVYDINTGVLARTKNKSSPFITLIEKVNNLNFQTVYYQEHSKYLNQPNNVQILNNKPLWCMAIHGKNYNTKFYGRPYLWGVIDLRIDFNFCFQIKPKISDRLFFFRSYLKKKRNKLLPYMIQIFKS